MGNSKIILELNEAQAKIIASSCEFLARIHLGQLDELNVHLFHLHNSKVEQKTKIEKALGNKNLTSSELEEVREIIKATGSMDYSKKLAKELAEQAVDAIKNASITQEGKDFLVSMADYMVNREY